MKFLLKFCLLLSCTFPAIAQTWVCQGNINSSMPTLEMELAGDARSILSVDAVITSLSDSVSYEIKADEEREIHDNGTLVTFYGVEDTFHDKYLLVINKENVTVTIHITDIENKVIKHEYTSCTNKEDSNEEQKPSEDNLNKIKNS